MLAIFTTTDSELKNRNNNIVKIIRPLSADECDIEDVGNMYKIKFQDGFITDAFEDELVFYN
jgi:hypothetical protein